VAGAALSLQRQQISDDQGLQTVFRAFQELSWVFGLPERVSGAHGGDFGRA
jgi:hypothetical protein